jgi:hypothetical protein
MGVFSAVMASNQVDVSGLISVNARVSETGETLGIGGKQREQLMPELRRQLRAEPDVFPTSVS